MTGRLSVVGMGPGAADLVTPEASTAVAAASDLVGYGPYLARLDPATHQLVHASDNREELDRARFALALAAEGREVVVVSSGDAGVFAMAAAVFEAIDHGEPAWRELDIRICPGVSAVLAVAARLGAPFGNDFAVLSLSDNLKPWAVVEQRLGAAAGAGFALALYNPISRARPWQLGVAFDLLRSLLPASVPVAFARAISREDEAILRTTLDAANPADADMRTLVVVGTAETRAILRTSGPPWLYTPRRVAAEAP